MYYDTPMYHISSSYYIFKLVLVWCSIGFKTWLSGESKNQITLKMSIYNIIGAHCLYAMCKKSNLRT